MKPKTKMLCALLFVLFSVTVAFGEEDGEGPKYKDAPYFSGMPNYAIHTVSDKEFDAYRFYNGRDCTAVEGKKFYRGYSLKENALQASDLQITRNYANAVKAMGGAVLFEGECSGAECVQNCGYRMMVGRVKKGTSELWIEVIPFNDGYDYDLTLIEKEAMKQEVTYSGILNALNTEGHIALYINFDTGKSTIKPDSRNIIDQIVTMMKDNPDLKIGVEGHTDNVGNPKSNQTLSEDRAKAVVAAIVKEGIDPTRLSAAGFGQDKPIADNKTEEGRAKNRRVELVKK